MRSLGAAGCLRGRICACCVPSPSGLVLQVCALSYDVEPEHTACAETETETETRVQEFAWGMASSPRVCWSTCGVRSSPTTCLWRLTWQRARRCLTRPTSRCACLLFALEAALAAVGAPLCCAAWLAHLDVQIAGFCRNCREKQNRFTVYNTVARLVLCPSSEVPLLLQMYYHVSSPAASLSWTLHFGECMPHVTRAPV
jgi:hypothetical protein